MISRMRSSPANASEICVPMDAICTSGAATSPTRYTYMNRSPSVIRPLSTSRPAITITSSPITPLITVVPAPTAEVPVIVCAMFRSSLCTPSANSFRSRRSDTYNLTSRMPPIDSASRPVTSALIAPRSRNSGRSVRKA